MEEKECKSKSIKLVEVKEGERKVKEQGKDDEIRKKEFETKRKTKKKSRKEKAKKNCKEKEE